MKPDQDNATCQDPGTSHSPDPALQPAEENPVEKDEQGRMESRDQQMEPRGPQIETEDQRRERMALQVAARNPRYRTLTH